MQQCNAMKSPIIQIFSNEDIEKTYNHKSTFYRQIVLNFFLFQTITVVFVYFYPTSWWLRRGGQVPPPAPPWLRPWGRVDDLSFLKNLSSFCFLSIEFHCTFPISYKILPYFVYYYCILVRM